MSICIDCMLLAGSLIVMAATTTIPSPTLTFKCYPNNTLQVDNPDDYTYVHANNSVSVCTTTWSDDKTQVFITDCGKDDDVVIFFSNLGPEYEDVLGGKTLETYIINCNEIPLTGETFTIVNGAQVAIDELEQTTYTNFDPEINITSGIYSDAFGALSPDETEIGTPLFWIIGMDSANYRLRPDECWAYAGKNIIDTVPKRKIYDNGCVVDDQLLSSFFKMGSNIVGRRALLFTFRFYGSEYVTFECQVRVCPYNPLIPTFCDSNECDTDRKKRDSVRSSDCLAEYQVKRTLRVVDYLYSSTHNGAPESWLFLPAIILLFKV